MSTRDELKRANEEYGGGSSNFFKFEKSGTFKLRLLTKPLALGTHFFGKGQGSHICYGELKGCPFHGENAPKDKNGNPSAPSVKFITYVLDRLDGRIKLGEIPYSVLGVVADLEEDADWKFENYPMPYDITVKYDKENKDPKQIYKTLGSPNRVDIDDDTMSELMKKIAQNSPEQFIQKRKEGEIEKQKQDGTWEKEQARREEISLKVASDMKNVQDDVPTVEYPDNSNVDDIPF